MNFAVLIMAAGKGTRLKSRHPKVLHLAGGKPLVRHVVDAALQIAPARDVLVVIGHEAERVKECLAPASPCGKPGSRDEEGTGLESGIRFVLQSEQLGTGHALMAARAALAGYDSFLVLSGDVPLIRPHALQKLRELHSQQEAAMTILSAQAEDPSGYGRILRAGTGVRSEEGAGAVAAIIEDRMLSSEQKQLREINSGIYAFSSRPFFAHLAQLSNHNPHGEYYLTDMAAVLSGAGEKVMALPAEGATTEEVLGVNTRAELARADATLRARKCAQLMDAGVTIYRPETCTLDSDATVGPDSIIDPFVQLLGSTRAGSDCSIGSYSVIRDCVLGDRVTVRQGCILTGAQVEDGAVLGPYCHLRPESVVGPGAHVGNFVEMKKTRLGKGAKANHLSYLGDATIGEDVNVGAGTITCNYDGVNKNPTVIDDGAFIGSDSILVAPVQIGRGAYVGAASCITRDVPPDSLAVGRARQVTKEGWAAHRKKRVSSKPL